MKKALFLLLLTILFAASCSQPKKLVYKNIQNFSLKQSQVSVDIRLYNPNSFSLKLKKADVDVFLNGSKLGKMVVADRIAVPALDTFSMPVILSVDLKNALPNVLQLLLSSEVNIKLQGTVKAGRHGVFIKVPVNYEGKQDIRSGIKW